MFSYGVRPSGDQLWSSALWRSISGSLTIELDNLEIGLGRSAMESDLGSSTLECDLGRSTMEILCVSG